MSEQWELGFQCGVLYAAAHIAGAFDEPTMAADLCRHAGITIRELRRCDDADRVAVQKIIRELVTTQRQNCPGP